MKDGMLLPLLRLLRWPAMGVLLLVVLVFSRDALTLNPAERASAPYLYDLVRWEAANFPSKWVHRLTALLPWTSDGGKTGYDRVQEYFELNNQVSRLETRLDEAAAREGDGGTDETARLQAALDELVAARGGLRNEVEETLESAISSIVRDEGFASWGEFVFPPVDARLTDPPKLLVTSPRDRIRRTHDVLLIADMRLEARERVEEELLRESNLAALVTSLGGVATYPASVPNDRSLLATLEIASHEWLHHYFFFRSLGQNISRSPQMRTLNETMADIAGREIGRLAYAMLGGDPALVPDSDGRETEGPETTSSNGTEFDFDQEMRLTRGRVDDLLAEGRIEEAEAYMEDRRLVFVENGFPIRKLNQAYFAFHGTYAESAASVSPVADQLHDFRDLMPDLRTFVKRVSGVSSYGEFLDRLEEARAEAGDRRVQ